MRKLEGKRPSPAMVVAATALIVAAAGTAMAAPTAIQSLTKGEKKKVKKIATNKATQAIDQRAPGLFVGGAKAAGIANTAYSANTAGSANSAGNADTVDGRHATCPGGYAAVAGVCYESSNHPPATWPAASNDCAARNASLPTVGQLKLALDELGNVSFSGEWTDSLHQDGGNLRSNAVNSAGAVSSTGLAGNVRAYRCVTPLVR